MGKPTEKFGELASGADPANTALSYKVFQRHYENVWVLYKPLSYVTASKLVPTNADGTTTKHDLGGTYRPLKVDGTLGDKITSIPLRKRSLDNRGPDESNQGLSHVTTLHP